MSAELVAFLRARLDEDEETAHATNETMGQLNLHWSARPEDEAFSKVVAAGRYDVARELGPVDAAHIARHDPARVLAEVEAKRDVVRLAERAHDYHETFMNGFGAAMEGALRLFALAYADHPDYRPEWRP